MVIIDVQETLLDVAASNIQESIWVHEGWGNSECMCDNLGNAFSVDEENTWIMLLEKPAWRCKDNIIIGLSEISLWAFEVMKLAQKHVERQQWCMSGSADMLFTFIKEIRPEQHLHHNLLQPAMCNVEYYLSNIGKDCLWGESCVGR
jgi:hypothetical protein